LFKLVHRFAVGFTKAFDSLTVFFEERAPYGKDALGKSFNVGEIDEDIQPSLGGFKGLRRRKRAGIYGRPSSRPSVGQKSRRSGAVTRLSSGIFHFFKARMDGQFGARPESGDTNFFPP